MVRSGPSGGVVAALHVHIIITRYSFALIRRIYKLCAAKRHDGNMGAENHRRRFKSEVCEREKERRKKKVSEVSGPREARAVMMNG